MQVKGSECWVEIWDRGQCVGIKKYRIVGNAVLCETWRDGIISDSDWMQPDCDLVSVLLATVADLIERIAKLETEKGTQDL